MTEPDAVQARNVDDQGQPGRASVRGLGQLRLPTPSLPWRPPVIRSKMPRLAMDTEQIAAALAPLAMAMGQVAEALAAAFPPPRPRRILTPVNSRYDYRQRVRNRRRRRKNRRTTR